jgi:hypothetical protein
MFKQHHLANRTRTFMRLNTQEGETWLAKESLLFRIGGTTPMF